MESLREHDVIEQAKWEMLRSDIYIRDKGVCWVCNARVELKDYDLGHLIDRCNGGADDYDNLAVMHKKCNISKPRHITLEEAMKWRLAPRPIRTPTSKPVPHEQITFLSSIQIATLSPSSKPIAPTVTHHKHGYIALQQKRENRQAGEELILEYFAEHPELLANGDGVNTDRIKATHELVLATGLPRDEIRAILLEHHLVPKRPPQVTDGSQYRLVYERLDELLTKYESIKHEFIYHQPTLMGIPHFWMEIMFYLAGMHSKISAKNFDGIRKRVAELGLSIRQPIS